MKVTKDMIEAFIDDPQSMTNHIVLGLDVNQRQQARGNGGKSSVPTWVKG